VARVQAKTMCELCKLHKEDLNTLLKVLSLITDIDTGINADADTDTDTDTDTP
jgi:hypothetical protein